MIQDISLGLLNAYKETINSYDEVLDQNGQVKPYWKGLFDTLESVGIEGLELRNQEIIKKLKENGVEVIEGINTDISADYVHIKLCDKLKSRMQLRGDLIERE